MRSPATTPAPREPASYRLNMLLVDIAPNPVVDIVYDPTPMTPAPIRVRVYQTIDTLSFTPADTKGKLFLPFVTAGGTPAATPPTFERIEIQTAIDPNFPIDYLYYRTSSLLIGNAMTSERIRHRWLTPGTAVPQLAGVTLITRGEVDDSFVISQGKKTLYTIRASNASVEFDVRWKRIHSGTDHLNPRDFFLQIT